MSEVVGPKIMYSIRQLGHAEISLAWLKFATNNPWKFKPNKDMLYPWASAGNQHIQYVRI